MVGLRAVLVTASVVFLGLPGSGLVLAQAPTTTVPTTPSVPADSPTVPLVPPTTPLVPPTTTPNPPSTTPGPLTTTPGAEDPSMVASMEIRARPALVLAGNSDWENGYTKIRAAIAKVSAAAAKNSLPATGHPVAAFVDTDDNGFKFEVMLPIEKAPEGRTDFGESIRAGATPGGKALKFQHRGAYDDIETTYEAITAYLDEKGFDAQNVFVEEYLNEPKGSDDTSAEVDIYVLVK